MPATDRTLFVDYGEEPQLERDLATLRLSLGFHEDIEVVKYLVSEYLEYLASE